VHDENEKRKPVFFSNEVLLTCLNVKAIPVQAWTSPAGSRRLRLPDFMTVCTLS
jgi:hypothetical protein